MVCPSVRSDNPRVLACGLSPVQADKRWYTFYNELRIYFSEQISQASWPRGYKTFFMLNSIEHEIFPAHKC